VATKVIIVQLVYAPIFGTLFFSYMAAMEGKGPLMVAQRVKHELMTAVRRACGGASRRATAGSPINTS
jgi:hypothetical protein